MSSAKTRKVSDDFLKMLDTLMLLESNADTKEVLKNFEIIENLEFHSSQEESLDQEESEDSKEANSTPPEMEETKEESP